MQNTAAIAAAERLKAQAGARVHRLGLPDELKEEAMPRGVYERAKKAGSTEPAAKAETPPAKKRGSTPKAEPAKKLAKSGRAAAPRFGVFDDGSVKLSLPGCAGSLTPTEARQFLDFLKRIGVKA